MPTPNSPLTDPRAVATADLPRPASLPGLIDRAATALASARTAAEVLEAREIASFAYDMAKRQARLAKAKKAHDDLIAATHRAVADALEIETQAKRRLADEYDAAQERGEVAGPRDGDHRRSDRERPPTTADLGLSRKDIHEARQIRDAEKAEPGIVKRTLQTCLAEGAEPSRASLRKAVGKNKKKGRRGKRHQVPAPTASQHERDLELIRSIWGGICQSAQHVFADDVRGREVITEAAEEPSTAARRWKALAPDMRSAVEALMASDPALHREFLIAASEHLMDVDAICAVMSALLKRKHPKNAAALLVDAFDRPFARAVADAMTELLDGQEKEEDAAEVASDMGVRP